MDPATGTFNSMDTYAGILSDPMSLHKYLFANSNPVMYSDPSGHETTLLECVEVCAIIGMLAGESLYLINCFVNDEKVTSGGVLLSAVIGGIVAIAIFFIVYAIVKLILIIISYFYVRPDQASSFSDNVKEVTENAIEKANSFILRKNMVSAGIEVPDYRNAAHHIVAGAAQKAQEARDVLSSFGIRINDSINGVFLPIVRDVSNAAYHPEIHTKIYYETVNQLLNDCNTKEDVISVLKYIADALSKNEFPY